MFRDRVVGHYVGRGYRVDTDAVLEGESGGQHKVDLMATDDLGRIAVWWGDQEPFEGPELESVKRAAKDLGAAPAIAAPEVTSILRDHARRSGVVVMDEATLDADEATMARPLPPRPLPDDVDRPTAAYPPWPSESRPTSDAAVADAQAAQAPWREERTAATNAPDESTSPRRPFDWLPDEGAQNAGVQRRRRSPAAIMPRFWGPLLYGAIALVVVLVVLAFVL